ncbi:transposase [Streptomyces sp. NPDC002734]|uniref:transposase n=1 Tax=Streptomyces sp. NPDC002734 TaxID=3154426 RepID=UPI0033221506
MITSGHACSASRVTAGQKSTSRHIPCSTGETRPPWHFSKTLEHPSMLFPAEMFADMHPSATGRPSMPPQVLAAAVVLQSLYGLSDFDSVQELRCDLRWKAACGLAMHDMAFSRPHPDNDNQQLKTRIPTGVKIEKFCSTTGWELNLTDSNR